MPLAFASSLDLDPLHDTISNLSIACPEKLEKVQEQFRVVSVPSPDLQVALPTSKAYTICGVSSTMKGRANSTLACVEKV